MDNTAIKEIQKTPALAEAIKQVSETDTPVAVLPNDFALQSLEQFFNTRTRFRGAFSTKSMPDFVAYIESQSHTKSETFISADTMGAATIFDIGDWEAPGHCEHTATLKLEKNPAYTAILDIHNRKHSQKDLAEWIEDWKENIQVEDQNGDTMTMAQTIAAIRRITISATAESTHAEDSFSASRSAMEEVAAKAADKMPATLLFTCTPYEGLNEHVFAIRLSIITSADKPTLSTRIVQLETEQEKLTNEFKEKLIDQLGDKSTVYIGNFNPK